MGCPSRELEGPFFTGWTGECLQTGHTHTKTYEICNPNSNYAAGLEPLHIIREFQTSNVILHGFQVTQFFLYYALPGIKMHLVITTQVLCTYLCGVRRVMRWCVRSRWGRGVLSGCPEEGKIWCIWAEKTSRWTMGKRGKQRERLFYGNLPDGYFQHILF